MYTYERLCELCKYDNNDSDIAYYLLHHLDCLEDITVSRIINDTGISKSSIHRFYNKGGYINFKELISSLHDEIKQKQLAQFNYKKYKDDIIDYIKTTDFDEQQIKQMINELKHAKKVAFYGNTAEISCLKLLQFYLFTHHIDVIYLDRWDINKSYQLLKTLTENDVFIMVESSWRIQLIYENSMIKSNMLSLDTIHHLPFKKFYIGEADCKQYLTYQNIKISYHNEYMPLLLHLLDQKISEMLQGG